MSYRTIHRQVRQQIWLRAGGRCEYPGCNVPLWRDELTQTEMNRAYLAHIIADTPGGPRGDPILSVQLSNDPANIMLLCDTHHRMIDREERDKHSVELLREYKQAHEERIEWLTSLQEDRRTQIVLFGSNIGDRRGDVNFAQACEAVLPDRYPSDARGIRLDLSATGLNENDPGYWNLAMTHIDRGLKWYLHNGLGPDGEMINHLSIFAIAPIPVLIYFGKQLGDTVSADVYQRHRSTNDWKWQVNLDASFNYVLSCPEGVTSSVKEIAINLSLSGNVGATEIEKLIGDQIPVYKITIQQPHRDYLHSRRQLDLFREEWYSLLAHVRDLHGQDCTIHLFPAVPNSVAVEIGRALLPNADPLLTIYNKGKSGFYRTIQV